MAPAPKIAKVQGKSKPQLAVVLLLLSLVGAAVGFAVGAVLAPKEAASISPASATSQVADGAGNAAPDQAAKSNLDQAPEGSAKSPAAAEPAPIVEVQVPMVILPLPPILTNLAEPKETWIRFEGSLLINKDTQDPTPILVEHAGEQILTFLRTVKLNQIAGPGGFLNLREDLNDTVAAASNGQVKEVLIHTMVME
jgi:flagellar protein FliL